MQTTSHLLMIRPAHFGYNVETAGNNAFQRVPKGGQAEAVAISDAAKREFDGLANQLARAGVQLTLVEDTPEPMKPDAVFPNNWVSFHQDATVISWPMFSPLRRAERREEIIDELARQVQIKERIHLEYYERENRFLEGTGSLILDREHKIAYACRSVRTDEVVLDEFCRMKAYRKQLFDAVDAKGVPVYHTNVMMALGRKLAVLCLQAVKEEKQRLALLQLLEETGKTVLDISLFQMNCFAGNMLEVRNTRGEPFWVMSRSAWESLSAEQRKLLERSAQPLYADLHTIEKYGGGSARCMLAEVFCPPLST